MKRAVGFLLILALVVAACGGDDGGSDTSPVEDDAQTDQIPPPETTPARGADETVPVETPTTPPADPTTTFRNDSDTTMAGDDGEGMAEGDGEELQVTESDDLGPVVAGPDGLTLYVFLPDEQSDSTCYDACAATWPPLEGEMSAGPEIDEALLGTIERTDGTTQATYDGWPLYYYANDAEPGDVAGQGVGDNWFVVDPAGEVVDG